MLFLLLVYSLTTRALPVPTVEDEAAPTACNDLNNCRSLLNIIWSCLSTIFLCTWVSMHPNIPEPVDTEKMSFWNKCSYKISTFFKDKVPLFVCALLIPEYILAWAIRQHLMAREIVKKNKDLKLTRTHGFFMIMGGFHYFTTPSDTNDAHEMTPLDPLLKGSDQEEMTESEEAPAHPLTWEDIISMVKQKQIKLPTKNEIQDKSKSDWLAKSLVLLQTCWFVMQCIARRVEHLPTTELEIITLAYAAMNFAIFVAWWDKPHNVDCPIRVFQRPLELKEGIREGVWGKVLFTIAGSQDGLVTLHEVSKIPIFYAGDTKGDAAVFSNSIVLVVGVVFGAIHCIAWSFTFSSHTEAVLWRASSIAITSIPIFVFVTSVGVAVFDNRFDEETRTTILVFSCGSSGVLYVAARFMTIVLAVMNLSSLPPGAFEAVDWTIRIPHLS